MGRTVADVVREAVTLCGWASGQGTQLHGLWSQ